MFSREYWRSSFAKLKDLRYLTLIAFFIALKYILNNFRIPVGENLNIMFSYIPTALEALVVGPGAAMVSAVITDLLTGVLSGYGPFFPGYMLSKMMSSLLFGLFFYRRKIRFLDVLAAKALVNYVVNVGLGSLWNSILFGKAFLVYAATSVIKTRSCYRSRF